MRGPVRPSAGRVGLGFAVSLLLGGVPGATHGQALTQEEALAQAFPSAEIERKTAYLSDAQLAEAQALAGRGVDVETGIVTYYVATADDRLLGTAYFDAHRVRTLPQVLMIVVEPDGQIGRVETVAFREPPEYRAPDGWLDLASESDADPADLPNIAGATLTADAVKRALRRTGALHRVIQAGGRPDEGQKR